MLGNIYTLNITAQPSHWHSSWHVIYFTKLNFWTNAFPWVSSASPNSVDFSPAQMHCRWRLGQWPNHKPLNIEDTEVCSQPCGPLWALWGSSAALWEQGEEEGHEMAIGRRRLIKKSPSLGKYLGTLQKLKTEQKYCQHNDSSLIGYMKIELNLHTLKKLICFLFMSYTNWCAHTGSCKYRNAVRDLGVKCHRCISLGFESMTLH